MPLTFNDAMDTASETPASCVCFRLGPIKLTPHRLKVLVVLLVFFSALTYFWQTIGLEEMLRRAKQLPAAGVIATISTVPLAGFPVSWLHLIAGVRFGFPEGLFVVAFAGLCHHFLGWSLVKILPRRLFCRFEPWRKKLVGAGHRDAALLCCLMPGMPYSVQLYLLPVMGVPLWLLLCLSVPLHTCRAVVTILLGNYGTDLTPSRIAVMAGYYLLLITVSAFIIRRLKDTLARKSVGTTNRNTATSPPESAASGRSMDRLPQEKPPRGSRSKASPAKE